LCEVKFAVCLMRRGARASGYEQFRPARRDRLEPEIPARPAVREPVAGERGVHLEPHADLAQVAQAGGRARPALCPLQGGQEQRNEDRDDPDHDEQFASVKA
jgi:hypothetical protein